MSSRFGLASRSGREWQAQGTGWQAHTLTPDTAQGCARGYLRLLGTVCEWRPAAAEPRGLDIGSGAGYLAAALAKQAGMAMTASEWNEDGLNLLRQENPALESRLIDITSFDDKDRWDLVVCRELYPFTRVNAFSDQHNAVSRILDSLKSGGAFLLVGSDVNGPHCADYPLLLKTFRRDPRLRFVSRPFLEAALRRSDWFHAGGSIAYRVACQLAELATWALRRRRCWAAIRVMAFVKK